MNGVIKGTNLTANDYLVKPVDFDILIAKLKQKIYNSKDAARKKLESVHNLCDKFSHVVSRDLGEYADFIIKSTDLLRNKSCTCMSDQYENGINRIRMKAMKLRSMLDNKFDKESLTQQLVNEEKIVDPKEFIDEFLIKHNSSLEDKMVCNIYDIELPNIEINTKIMESALVSVLEEMTIICVKDEKIRINLFRDCDDNFTFALHGKLKRSIGNIATDKGIQMDEAEELLQKQNAILKIELHDKNEIVVLIILHKYCTLNKS